MRIVLAFDKFKGTADALELIDAATQALASTCDVVAQPLADGGEGSLAALGGPNKETTVTGPLGQPVRARWRLDGRTASIEMAESSGLTLAGGPEGNDPIGATTRGVGELINKTLELRVQQLQVFLGGSATTDGGLPALEVLSAPSRLQAVDVVIATDVSTSFLDAAEVFGPQKGATAAQTTFLRRRLESVAQIYRDRYGVDVTGVPGTGAAGGLAGGLYALGGRIEPGFDVVASHVGFDEMLGQADLVITGEGHLDAESFSGKVVGSVWRWAKDFDLPVLAVVGQVDRDVPIPAGMEVISISEEYGMEAAMAQPADLVAKLLESRFG